MASTKPTGVLGNGVLDLSMVLVALLMLVDELVVLHHFSRIEMGSRWIGSRFF